MTPETANSEFNSEFIEVSFRWNTAFMQNQKQGLPPGARPYPINRGSHKLFIIKTAHLGRIDLTIRQRCSPEIGGC